MTTEAKILSKYAGMNLVKKFPLWVLLGAEDDYVSNEHSSLTSLTHFLFVWGRKKVF